MKNEHSSTGDANFDVLSVKTGFGCKKDGATKQWLKQDTVVVRLSSASVTAPHGS